MLASERHARIVEMLRDSRVVSTDDFSHALKVSTETIRRDLVTLDSLGLLERVHGGASITMSPSAGEEAPFAERSAKQNSAKTRMGIAAAKLVSQGQTIVIDVGTTAVSVARAIPMDFSGTVATSSLLVAAELADRPHLDVLVSGGKLRAGDLALSNSLTDAFFADLYPDIAFLGSGGLDDIAGLTDYYLDEATARKTIVKNATRSFVLADSTKFGRVARHRVVALRDLAGLITDQMPPAGIAEAVSVDGGIVIVS